MDGLQAPPHGRREVRSYTANRRKLRFGVVAAEAASGCLLTMTRSTALDAEQPVRAKRQSRHLMMYRSHGMTYTQCASYSIRSECARGTDPVTVSRVTQRGGGFHG